MDRKSTVRADGGQTRCPDCCMGFDGEEALREHYERWHEGGLPEIEN